MREKKLNNFASKYIDIDRYQPLIDNLMLRLRPLKDYWIRSSARDQQILMGVGAIIALMLISLIISSALQFRVNLENNYNIMAAQRIDSEVIASQYRDLSQTTPNDFSSVNSERIKGDAAQILDVKDAEIIIADNTLSVKAKNARFEKILQFLDQLRKNYGLFPSTLTITRGTQAGYADFKVSFSDVEQ